MVAGQRVEADQDPGIGGDSLHKARERRRCHRLVKLKDAEVDAVIDALAELDKQAVLRHRTEGGKQASGEGISRHVMSPAA
ncbi:hypothetical protein GCM10011341_18890 [Frigidibacter albus]|nr:hypothetical protein GCM10011341_18890 [Frigidibacter albus]